MKKVIVVALVIALSMIGANAAMATIANSKHDMSTLNYGASRHMSSCQYCHAPHNPVNQTVAPLWNRSTDSGASLTDYSFYATSGVAITVGPASLTCLTCHDGTLSVTATKINQRGNAASTPADTATIVSGKIGGSSTALIGPDLSDDHPVGVVFGASTYAGVNTSFTSAGTDKWTVGTSPYRAYGATGAETVQCSSCHDPHGNDYAANQDDSPFLRGSIETICSDCHDSK